MSSSDLHCARSIFSTLLARALSVTLLGLCSACTSLFFVPLPGHVQTPADRGFAYEDVRLIAGDGTRLHAWWLPGKDPRSGTVYYLHGNAQNVSYHINAVLWLVNEGYDVLALDYRGYGLSEGAPDVPEVFLDIDAGSRWLAARETTSAGPLFLLGQSLGGSLAITYLARYPESARQFDGLIVEAAFARYDTMARHVADSNWFIWAFQYPVQWLIGNEHDPLDAIGALQHLPILLIHSPDDSIVPYRNVGRLLAQAGACSEHLRASGEHIRAFADATLRRSVLQFLDSATCH